MKNIILAAALCAVFSGIALADSHESLVADARGVVKQFFGSLKKAL